MAVVLRPLEPRTTAELVFFLERHGCGVTAVTATLVLVELPHDLHEKQARMELELYLRLWEVLHGVRVEVAD
jgi:hypothetical protein